MTKVYGCYLLKSSSRPPCAIALDPRKRLQEHNGVIKGRGAIVTEEGRPWHLMAVVDGFNTKIKAEHFEQAWKRGASGGTFQHTNKSAKEKMEQQQQNTPKEHVTLLMQLLNHSPWCCPEKHHLKVYLVNEKYENYCEGAMPLPVHIEREVIPASEIPLPRKIEPAESSQPQNLCISSSTSSSSSRVDSSSDTEKDSSLETGTGNSSQPCRRPPTSSLHNPATSSVALGGATQCSQAAAVGKAVAGVAAMGTGSAAGVGRGATSSSNRGCLLVAAAVDVGSSSCSQVGDLKGRCWRSSWGDERQQQEEGNPAAFWADYDFAPKPEYCKQYERERQNDAIAPEDVWEVLSRPQSSSDASGASDVNLKEKVHDRNMLCISSTLLHETASGVEHPKLPNSSHSSRMTDVIPKQERTNSSDSGCCMQGQGDGNITTATAGNLLYDELIVDWAMPAVNVRVCDDIYDLRVLAPRKATKHSSKAPGSAAAKGNNRGAQKPAAPFLKALRLLEYSLYSSSLAKAPKKASDDIRVPDNVNARSVLLGLVARLFKR